MPSALYAALAVAILALLAYAVYSQSRPSAAAPAASGAGSGSAPGPAPPTCKPACGPGTACALGGPGDPAFCAPAACEGPADCGGPGFACADGACAPLLACTSATGPTGCSADSGGPGGPCVGGFCLPPGSAGCTADAMCPTGYSCSQPGAGGACVLAAPPTGKSCPGVPCGKGLVCDSGTCVAAPSGPPACSPTCVAPAVCAFAVDPATGRQTGSCVAPPTLPDRVCMSWAQPSRGSSTRNALATVYGGSGPFYFTWDLDDEQHQFAPTMNSTSMATTGDKEAWYGVTVTTEPYKSVPNQPMLVVHQYIHDYKYSGCWCSDGSACP